MPRKVDFHTEWAMPDQIDFEDAGSDERKSGAPGSNPQIWKQGKPCQKRKSSSRKGTSGS
jgi:hypothetical protein